jgi:AraC-like DNA-binding protein
VSTDRPTNPAVTTVLQPLERPSVDAAGAGRWQALHRDSLDDAVLDLRARRAAAVLLSVAKVQRETPRVARVVREFPQAPAVALLSPLSGDASAAVLALGASGVRHVVDVRAPQGWRALREVLRDSAMSDLERTALAQLAVDLAGVPDDCWLFFETIFREGRAFRSVQQLARALGVLPSTLMSRFFRAGLPAPRTYLFWARLARIARLAENPGVSLAGIATQLEFSSPQSFNRHVRLLLGISASEFRRRYDGEGMLQRYRSELVTPHVATLRGFSPLAGPMAWRVRRD